MISKLDVVKGLKKTKGMFHSRLFNAHAISKVIDRTL